ncbi:Planctomycete cytochrome C [Thalassoglobus neptunius]|uniref:Planctomycete cytochrome C n=1 Tax=Thalassoglobus neptunius TaxID=1938619 RepID=A0A5C5X2M9_9PLAN|nr:PSD1 and planctomycete cytochrome C domain-containing protein [Thalassoglobus neptunius]TWT57100.1 Planctomycete cytochrome C [Thalassoglobus neptunius]
MTSSDSSGILHCPLPFPILVALLLQVAVAASAEEFTPRQLEFFEKKIRPVLVERCYECHSAEAELTEGGLRVDLREALLQGGDSGAAVAPNKPAESLILKALEYRDGLEMPPDGRLDEKVVNDFRRWIEMGAPDTRQGDLAGEKEASPSIQELADSLWSLQPVRSPPVPEVVHDEWPRSSIDHFLLSEMEERDISPVADATPEKLLRRVSLDLVGFPPSSDQVREFLSDPSFSAYARYVDSLLASPQFGERWARHWFDVARYAESAGNSRDVLMPYAWRYRDYVIDAINDDISYDRFIQEQIAGDLLDAKTHTQRERLQVATGFLAIGSKSLNGGNLTLDLADDQIDVIGKAVLGLTVSCARCHDHKFDPIPTADYYALAGIFQSTETLYGGSIRRPKDLKAKLDVYLPIGAESELAQVDGYLQVVEELAELKKKRTKATAKVRKLEKALPENWKELEKSLADAGDQLPLEFVSVSDEEETAEGDDGDEEDVEQGVGEQIAVYRQAQRENQSLIRKIAELEGQEAPEISFAIGVRDKAKVKDFPIQIRGEKSQAGEVVKRGFLSVISLEGQPGISSKESGRWELAQWLTDEDQPLTPRVAVNRIWMHLFGKGLVESIDNFGVNSSPPSHPELLDHLAYRFVHEFSWSRKAMVREIVLSRAYRLATTSNDHNEELDAQNEMYWRGTRRRVDAEVLRDSMLRISGELQLDRPEASIVTQIGEGEVGRGIKVELLDQPYPYRSVYLPIIRGIIPEFLKVFDFPEPSNPQGVRFATNVPSQSLFLMNSPFVLDCSEHAARSLLNHKASDTEMIEELYLRVFCRKPLPDEESRLLGYIDSWKSGADADEKNRGDLPESDVMLWSTVCQAVFASAEFRYVD